MKVRTKYTKEDIGLVVELTDVVKSGPFGAGLFKIKDINTKNKNKVITLEPLNDLTKEKKEKTYLDVTGRVDTKHGYTHITNEYPEDEFMEYYL